MAIKTGEKPTLTVKEECGVIGTRKNGRETLRLDYGTWGGNNSKYEIRVWYETESGEKAAGKGIGLTGEELIALGELIQKLQQDEEDKAETAPAKKPATKKTKKTA